jgi:threonine synthase
MPFPRPDDFDPDTARTLRWNPALEGLRCLACGTLYAVQLRHDGCPRCAAQGRFVSLAASYRAMPREGVALPFEGGPRAHAAGTIRASGSLARSLGVAAFQVLDESANPTGSHKDRMSAAGIAHALLAGAHTVVLASSGNAAVSAAAYARAAGLRCEVATYDGMPQPYVDALATEGAVRSAFPDNAARWAYVERRARDEGVLPLTNYHLPALGSAPLAIEGYKAIADELARAGRMPDDVLVPTARGDLLWGIHRGLRELLASGQITAAPRLWAVEPFPRLSRVLAGAGLHDQHPGRTGQFSTAGNTTTWLQYQAVTESGGGAIAIDDTAARAARQRWIAAGWQPELCAAATLAAAHQLVAQGRIPRSSHVCAVLTAGAARDPSWPDPPSVEALPDLSFHEASA